MEGQANRRTRERVAFFVSQISFFRNLVFCSRFRRPAYAGARHRNKRWFCDRSAGLASKNTRGEIFI